MIDPTRVGVLLANLGTPEAPTPKAVRRFLAEFLSDPRVIDYPRWLWWPILHGVILRVRPAKSAHAYAQIWTPQGSPLLVQSHELAQAVQTKLGERYVVTLGMTYGAPSIAAAFEYLRAQNIRRIVTLPLYPQYSTTTTAAVFDRVDKIRIRANEQILRVEHYYSEPAYLDALAESIRVHWRKYPRRHLLFSFHGIPQRYVNNGDPYYNHCVATVRGTVERLNLDANEWSFAFQSRVGREQWLQPYTDQLLAKYATQGPRDVSVICPAFATDCLETLEEIALRNREDFLRAGGGSFDYIPCLNAQPSHAALFADLVRRIAPI